LDLILTDFFLTFIKKKLKSLFLIICTISFFSALSQDISVSDLIREELIEKSFVDNSKTFHFKVVYPKDYDSLKSYPVFLGISGGNQ
jgi:hypothetical protein